MLGIVFSMVPRLRRLRRGELGVVLVVAGFALLQWLHAPTHAPAAIKDSLKLGLVADGDEDDALDRTVFTSGPPGK